MLTAICDLERLRQAPIGERILFAIEDALEDSPWADAGFDVDDIARVALAIAGLDEPTSDTAPFDASAEGTTIAPVDEDELDASLAGAMRTRIVLAVDGEIDAEPIFDWIRDEVPELDTLEYPGGEIMGNDIFAVGSASARVLVANGLAIAEQVLANPDRVTAALDDRSKPGVVHVNLDAIGDVVREMADALPEFVRDISGLTLQVDVTRDRDAAMAALASAEMTSDGAARVAVTGLEAARAAWALAGLKKKFPWLQPVIQNVSFRAVGDRLEIELVLDDGAAAELVDQLLDLFVPQEDDDDWE